jgi:hypothetical protein
MRKLIFILFATALYISCVKPVAPKEDFCAEGHMFWGGDPSTNPNGLGYFFAIKRTGNWKFYQVKESALTNEFKSQTDSIAVNICLKSTKEEAPCPCVQPSYYYEVKSISKR